MSTISNPIAIVVVPALMTTPSEPPAMTEDATASAVRARMPGIPRPAGATSATQAAQ